MKNKLTTSLIVLALSFSPFAHAGVYRADFSFHSFTDIFASYHPIAVPAPQSDVTGSFVYTAASMYGTATSLVSLDLEIADHSYTLAEVSVWDEYPTPYIGGNAAFIWSIYGGWVYDDFILVVRDPASGIPNKLQYTTPNNTIFGSSDSQIVITEVASVPEPSSSILLFGAAIAARLMRRRRNGR